MKMSNLDEIIKICKKFEEIRKSCRYGYGAAPMQIIETCNKLKAMELNWGDDLVTHSDFHISDHYYISNSSTGYTPTDKYYIHWDNGNIGRLQFVNTDYWGYIADEWREFNETLRSYNAVDWDPLNDHIIFKIEDGKRLMNDYQNILKDTQQKIENKIKAVKIEKKKKELEELMKDDIPEEVFKLK